MDLTALSIYLRSIKLATLYCNAWLLVNNPGVLLTLLMQLEQIECNDSRHDDNPQSAINSTLPVLHPLLLSFPVFNYLSTSYLH